MPGKLPGMTVKPAQLDLTIYQGATFREPLTRSTYPYPVRVEEGEVVKLDGSRAPESDATPEDYTGCTARMQVRATLGSATVLFELTTANGGIVLDGDTLTLELSPAQTAALAYGRIPPSWVCAVGHVEVIRPNGDVERQYEIQFCLDPEGTV